MRKSRSSASRASKLSFLSAVHAKLHHTVEGFVPMEASGFARPPKPLALSEIFPGYEADEHEDYPDHCGFPWNLNEKPLLSISWESGLGCSYELYAVDVPGGFRVYVEFYEMLGNRVLATSSGIPHAHADQSFIELLLTSNGAAFGTEIFGGPPDFISVGGDLPRERWIEIFCACFGASNVWSELHEFGEPADWYAELERIVHAEEARKEKPAQSDEQKPDGEDETEDEADSDDEDFLDDEPDWFSEENCRKLVAWFLEQHGIGR